MFREAGASGKPVAKQKLRNEDQISDGDYVVVKKQENCRDGEIVVTLIDGQEATLKRFYREQNRIRLEPANSNMKPIYSDNVDILGVVIGVVHRY